MSEKTKLLQLLHSTLDTHEDSHTLWLGGSSATKQEDSLSDIDLMIISHLPEGTFRAIEEKLEELYGILHVWVPSKDSPYKQKFYVLKNLAETFYLDVVIYVDSDPKTICEYFNQHRHGTPQILFDKKNILKEASVLIHSEGERNIFWSNEIAQLEIIYRTFLKECLRRKYIDAFAFYHRLIHQLIHLQRTIHSPERHDFGMRYLTIDLPVAEARFIEELLRVSSLEEMAVKGKSIKDKIYNLASWAEKGDPYDHSH